ncbi:uncharacterized protein PGTG_14882 [Puccinia graminis f. sp. tritici CRL 75-36-700-3]|uniref:BZIP domain-containing protein n=1 Tax=Puccinia graminis f. sp. tritici (strain CRL 75-36-700-3 / race SCCL) TaxID=418459 RepID=E3KXV5_PUCGT|nr:uncharacterized protein PGTG_14882 [Puccinia graminis f. sp. tritici CRL 75-36-700-3]EFP89041.1 hypothetical protein PGTG_14882 [Puccinia graminis f. sp. tritici CRL 75-36-700-3]
MMMNSEEIEINEWLDLDQADEDIGLLQFNNDYNNNSNSNNQRFSFDSTLPQFTLNQHQLIQPTNHLPIISLDPSTILNYPTSSSTSQIDHPQRSNTTSTSTTTTTTPAAAVANSSTPATQLNQFNNPVSIHHNHNIFDRPADHHQFPTYALDPALLTASIPSHHRTNPINNNENNNCSSGNSSTTVNNSSASTPQINQLHQQPECPKPFSKNLELKITLPRRSPSSHPSFKQEEEEEDGDSQDQRSVTIRSSHSRSSSAINFGQQPTPSSPVPPSHKRTLSHSHPLVNVPEWEDKPSAEEYKMLSSKEKRQLRNKISARNFRHRRKQHISALEQQVAQRDQTIEALYNDLGAAQNENKELKSQVELLKQKWSDLMKKIEEMSLGSISPAAPTSITTTTNTSAAAQSTSALPASPRLRSAKANAMIPLPNLHKDLGSHTRKPFNGVGGMAGGNVGVHTTLIPDVLVDVYKGPIGSRLDPGRRSGIFEEEEEDEAAEENMSPQAMLEQKLDQQGSKHSVDRCNGRELGQAWKLFPSDRRGVTSDELIEKARGIGPGVRSEIEGPSEGEVRSRLWQMVYEAMRPDNEINNNDEALNIDPYKLAACLDGRLVLKLVEPAPPPYPFLNSSASSVDLLATRVANSLSFLFHRLLIST